MPDPRFFEFLGPVSLAELAELTGAALANPADGERRIESVAPLGQAGARDLAFLSDPRHIAALADTRAGVCFVRSEHATGAPAGCAVLVVRAPQAAWAQAARRLFRPRRHTAAEPAIHPDAVLEEGVVLGHGVVIGPGAHIGARTAI